MLAIGASQSAGRMTTYYNVVLPQEAPVFDGYAFIVGMSVPRRAGAHHRCCPRRTCRPPLNRRPDSDVFRRWRRGRALRLGRAGIPHSARDPRLRRRDDPPAPTRRSSRVWLSQVIEAAYGHLARWVDGGAPPPQAPYLGSAGRRPGTECARTGPRRHPAVAGRRADRAQRRLELGAVVLPAPGRMSRSAAATVRLALPEPRQLRVGRAGRRSRQRGCGFLIHADALENLLAASSDVGSS